MTARRWLPPGSKSPVVELGDAWAGLEVLAGVLLFSVRLLMSSCVLEVEDAGWKGGLENGGGGGFWA